MSNQNEELTLYFNNYMRDLNENGLRGITSYYNEPSMVISPTGVTVLKSNKEVVDLFQPMLDEFDKQDYDRMEVVELNTKVLNDTTAIVSNKVIRYKKDGSEFNRASGTYILHKNSQGWKIASLLMMDADSVIHFE